MSNFFSTFSTAEWYLTGISAGLFLLQLFFILYIYARPLRLYKKNDPATDRIIPTNTPVSVIVYAHREPEALERNLPFILEQEYPDYEVIVVNDGSDAESEDILKRFSLSYKHLYYSFVPVETRYLSHKKLALMIGIKAAKHDKLLFTEASCRPLEKNWIASMAGSYREHSEIILGFSSYGNYPGIWQKICAYENVARGLQCLSSALGGHPFFGDGRNLSYRQSLFFAHKGYSQSLNLHAGADDLFVNETADGHNTRVNYSPSSITETDRLNDFSAYKEVKIAQKTTRKYYRGWQSAVFRLDTAGFICLLAASIFCIGVGIGGNWFFSLLGGSFLLVRWIIKMIVFKKSATMLRQSFPVGWLPFIELLLPVWNGYFALLKTNRTKKDFTSKI